jgi:toxin ParE1/3/4
VGDYKLTPEAEQDLSDIIKYTLNKWGKGQAVKYVSILEHRFKELSDADFLSRHVFGDIYSSYCEHHYIFFIKSSPAKIIAVLHENMDLVTRLKKRLSIN